MIGILGIYEDITQYKQAEQDLLESESRFRKLFEETAEATLLLESRQVIDMNRAALKLLRMENEPPMPYDFIDIAPIRHIDGRLSADRFAELLSVLQDQNAQQEEWELNTARWGTHYCRAAYYPNLVSKAANITYRIAGYYRA